MRPIARSPDHTALERIAMNRCIITATLIVLTAFAAGCQAPRSTEAVRESADHNFKYGYYDKAAEDYAFVVSRYPGDWQAQSGLGRSLLELGEYAGARRALELAHTRRPANPEIADALAEAMFHLGDYQQLFAFLRQRAEAAQTPQAYLRLAHYALELNDPDSARVALNTAITLDAGASVEPYLNAADFAERIGDMDMAVRRLRQAYGINPYDRRVTERLLAYGEVPGPTLALPPGR